MIKIKSKKALITEVTIVSIIIFTIFMLNEYKAHIRNNEITYSEFINLLDNDQVSEVKIDENYLSITPSNNASSNKTLYTANLNDPTLVPTLEEYGVKFYGKSKKGNAYIGAIFPTIIFIAAIWFVYRYIVMSIAKYNLLVEIRDLLKEKQ